ncbi:TonB family protein [Dysgonomonas sp. PFB1-18]|uniref:energy transducer TonB n=1 Tax=unclassified Dysgonomonas TaxID=2630389 RepID=UPI0024762B2B|nr:MULTISPECIES: energy transducer TonB [unclassified Dysgonomonas]MDH6308396.1 TonB family protein [Dysgonomonas sp. PF1-14]MDH6337897.1 TonB family protein [Dysgonomonas sp. PF1-16]MDH6379394.1 TonB family protein [Dysgonomonas sp. PFB1-18]MDH6396725.1 TonB family protein [Dysgonomonas sp. PF1-23]
MKKIFSILVLLFFILSCFGQQEEKEVVFTNPYKHPRYVGGEQAMYKFIEENLVYPPSVLSENIKGRITVRFLIRTTGVVDSVRIIKGINSECDQAALDVVKKMPEWEPGGIYIDGKAKLMDIWFTLPIKFDPANRTIKNGNIYRMPDHMPSFPEGEMALYRFIRENLKYPVCNCDPVEGRVTVRFIVTDKGDITDITILKGLENRFDKETIRLIQSMPKWIPAQHDGKDVNAYYTLPVVFRLY